jgi:Putative redox-active protein (C_GCAxxG_C_C)
MDDHLIRMMQLSRKGFVCSQIIMQMALDIRGEKNPSLIRSMAGLGFGCGSGQGTCGAMTAGACVLALYAAKGADDETESNLFMPMLEQLSGWFAQRVGGDGGGITCDAIVGENGPAVSKGKCGQIVSDTYAKTLEILVENGFDLSG